MEKDEAMFPPESAVRERPLVVMVEGERFGEEWGGKVKERDEEMEGDGGGGV